MNHNPYEFEYIEDVIYNSYVFETFHGTAYQVKFKPTPYLFSRHPDLSQESFELVISTVSLPTGKVPPDSRIPATVAAICQNFFADKERILLYICETADLRHLARVRKFDAWFREFNASGFFKIDANLPDTNGVTYYLSLIFRLGHPHLHTIVDEFAQMARRYDEDK